MVEVVAALIWDKDRFMICQRPANKARALLWEFVGGKIEPGETKEQALIRECQEELAITLSVGEVFMDVIHEYPDITVHLTLFNATIADGIPQKLEHNDIKWITSNEIPNYEFCPADEEILKKIIENQAKTLVESTYPYFKVLETINCNLIRLIQTNSDFMPYENEELFYQISSDLVRLLPYKIPWKDNKPDFEKAHIDKKSGIVLLKSEIPFLYDEYQKILINPKCLKALHSIQIIRNKYVHEPHNIRFSFSVGGKTSCSMGLYYKDKLYSISTIWLTNIIYDINVIFIKLQKLCIQKMNACDTKYQEYSCFQFIEKLGIDAYCKQFNRLPWEYIKIDSDYIELSGDDNG